MNTTNKLLGISEISYPGNLSVAMLNIMTNYNFISKIYKWITPKCKRLNKIK